MTATSLNRLPAPDVARLVAALRVASGLTFAAAPERAGGLLIGRDARSVGTRLFVAAFGARDALLGIGTLRALRREESARSWLALCAAADAFDAAATLTLSRKLGKGLRTRSFVASIAPAIAEAWLALELDGAAQEPSPAEE